MYSNNDFYQHQFDGDIIDEVQMSRKDTIKQITMATRDTIKAAKENSKAAPTAVEDAIDAIPMAGKDNINALSTSAKDITMAAPTAVDANPVEVDANVFSSLGGSIAPIVPSDKDSLDYNITGLKKVIIFNNTTFKPGLLLTERKGGVEDEKSIKTTFNSLQWNVETHRDLNAREIRHVMQNLQTSPETEKLAALAIFILSHGKNNKIVFAKDSKYRVDKVVMSALTADNCPQLAGKPKLVIVHACNRKRKDTGVEVIVMDPNTNQGSGNTYTIPKFADFLILRSSFWKHYSYRCPRTGSWLVQALCNTIKQSTEDNLSLMTAVLKTSRSVALDKEVRMDEPTHRLHQTKQMPLLFSTMMREVYLKDKSTKRLMMEKKLISNQLIISQESSDKRKEAEDTEQHLVAAKGPEDTIDATPVSEIGGFVFPQVQGNPGGTRIQGFVPTEKNSAYYVTSGPKKVIIFNHYRLSIGNREGTDEDAKAIQETFKALGWEVELLEDPSASEIRDVLHQLQTSEETRRLHALAIFILTHGKDNGTVFSLDSKYRVDRDIVLNLTADKCPYLAGKPKIIVIQACQGHKFDRGFKVRRRHHQTIYDMTSTTPTPATYRTPNFADFMFFHSSCFQHHSVREESGSWFIQTLCKKIQNSDKEDDLQVTLVPEVTRSVAFDQEYINLESPELNQTKQMPMLYSTMLRRLFLKEEEEEVKETFENRMESCPNLRQQEMRRTRSRSSGL